MELLKTVPLESVISIEGEVTERPKEQIRRVHIFMLTFFCIVDWKKF